MTHAPDKLRADVVGDTIIRYRAEKRWQKFAVIALSTVVLFALALVAFQWWLYSSTHEVSDSAFVQDEIYEVTSRVPGTISQLHVSDNTVVKKGQLIAELEQTDFRVKLEQATAALNLARRQAIASSEAVPQMLTAIQAKVEEAEMNQDRMQKALRATNQELQQYTSELAAAKQQLSVLNQQAGQAARQQEQLQIWTSTGAISPMQAQQMALPVQQAEMQKQAVQQQIQMLQSKITGARQTLAQIKENLSPRAQLISGRAQRMQVEGARQQAATARAAIAQAEAGLKEAQLLMSYTKITAPESGVMSIGTLKKGQRIQAGEPLVAIVKNAPWLVANFKETQYANIRKGQLAEIKLASLPNKVFTGHVVSIAPALAPVALVANNGAQLEMKQGPAGGAAIKRGTPMVPVKIAFDPRSIRGFENYIRHGMSAKVSIRLR